MRKLVYHIGISLDNYISDENGKTEGFMHLAEGEHVTEYLNSLKEYDTVVMGRATYEYGYDFGMKPGDAPYPHMKHYIFSKTLRFEGPPDERVQIVADNEVEVIRQLKEAPGTDIYLCGGGAFAGFLLDRQLIDEVRIKLYPILLGHGIRMFGQSRSEVALSLLDAKTYETGVSLIRYRPDYSKTLKENGFTDK